MTYRLLFEIEGLPKTTNGMTSMHWRTKGKYVRSWHQQVWGAVGARKPREPLLRAKLILTRFSSCEPDFDGLVSSWKHVLDGLIRCGVLKDDKMSNIGRPEYLWAYAPGKKGKIRVQIEGIE